MISANRPENTPSARSAESAVHGLSIVIPAYRSTKSLIDLVDLIPQFVPDQTFEIIFVDDASPPETWQVIQELSRRHNFVRGVRLGRNSGQHAALLAGIREARYELTLTIDDDLQHPPDQIPLLLHEMKDGIDVVYGHPSEIAQSRFRRSSSKVLRWLLSVGLGQPQWMRASAFCLLRTKLRDAFDSELGPGVSIDALLGWATQRVSFVEVRHDVRAYETSNYKLRRLIRFAMEIIVGYSTIPLRLSLRLGFLTIIFGLGTLAWVLGRLIITGTSSAGFPFLASTITIFAGVQLISLGVLGEYVGSIHQRVMRKPTYFVAETTSDSAYHD